MKPLAEQTFYEILEVPIDAPIEEIERAFQRAMQFYGPDSLATYSLADGGESGQLIELIEEAYLTLSDPNLRRAYDEERGIGQSAGEPEQTASAAEAPLEAQAGTGPKAEDGQPSLDSAALAGGSPQAEAEAGPPSASEAPTPAADSSPDGREASPAAAGQLAFGSILAASRHYPWPGSCPESDDEGVASPLEAPPAEPPPMEPAAALSQAAAVAGPLAAQDDEARVAGGADGAGAIVVVAPSAALDEEADGLAAAASDGQAPQALQPSEAAPLALAPDGGDPVEPAAVGEPASPAILAERQPGPSGETKPLLKLLEPPAATAVAASVEAAHLEPRSSVQASPTAAPAAENPAEGLPAAPCAEAVEISNAVVMTGSRESPASLKAEARADEQKQPAQPLPRMPDIPPNAVFNGELLRRIREGRGLTIRDLADRTKISPSHLENIEADRYEALPVPVYLRGFLMLVARELKLDPLKVSKSFLELVAKVGSKA
ncbi:MAG: helix-turn-helix domain-containing protein [Myxococcales bacterium]|jgi:hypothetical protein